MLKNFFVRYLVIIGGLGLCFGTFIFMMESGYSRAISTGGALAVLVAVASILFALKRAGPRDI